MADEFSGYFAFADLVPTVACVDGSTVAMQTVSADGVCRASSCGSTAFQPQLNAIMEHVKALKEHQR